MALFGKGKRQHRRDEKAAAAALAEGHEDLAAWEGETAKSQARNDPARGFVGTSLRLLFGQAQGRLPGPRHPRPRS